MLKDETDSKSLLVEQIVADIQAGAYSKKKYEAEDPAVFSAASDEAFAQLNIKGFKKFTIKHGEIWKFIKFTFAGASSSLVELLVNTLCVSVIFAGITGTASNGVLAYITNLLKLDNMGVFYSYMISTTVGYTIAFIINRKTTFKADSNVALSVTLYVIMVIFTIFANAFIGVYLTKWFATFWAKSVARDMVIKCIGMTIPTLWTYPLNRFVIHRHKKHN